MSAERRRAARVRITTDLKAKVKTFLDAHVVDFSKTGALLELDHPLPPRAICEFRVIYEGEEIRLHAQVKRCQVEGHGTDKSRKATLVYHAALEFAETDWEAAGRLADHFEPAPERKGAIEVAEEPPP